MDRKFLIGGEAVVVIESLKQGFLVRKLYETFDEQGYEEGEPFIVNKIYDTAPLEIFDKKIKDLQSSINEKENCLRILNQDINSYKNQIKEFEKNKSKYPDLSLVIDIADGKKILLVELYSLKITTYPDNHRYEGKLLKSISWQSYWENNSQKMRLLLGTYSDTSGSLNDIAAFRSKDEAVDFVQKQIDKNLLVFGDMFPIRSEVIRAIEAANTINYTSENVIKYNKLLQAYKQKERDARILKLRKEIDELIAVEGRI